MNNTDKALTRLGVLSLLTVLLGMTGCQSSRDRSLAQQWGDRQVAGQVKKELSRDPFYKYPDVHPIVYEGTVQLTGFVETAEQRQQAAELASHAKGARQIINVIELKPTPTIQEQFKTNAPAPSASVAPAAAPVRMMRTPAGSEVPTQGAGAAKQLGR